MKKKFMCIIGLMLAMALVCSLIGCSGGDVTSSSNPAESTVQTSIPTEATIPGESEPAETGTAAPSPSEAETVMTEVPETKPTETEAIPSETKPAETEPAPVETKPAETEAAPVETKPVETEPVPTETEHQHSYSVSKTVAPTCTDQGYTVYKCSCGDSYKGDKKDATGHSWGEWTVTKEATTEAEGSKERTCSACGEVQTKTIEKMTKELELSDPATEFEMEVAKAIFKCINQFRVEEGSTELTWLDGMSQVAEYRSRQLVTNMAHDTADQQEAKAFFQYGKYIDYAEMGYPELSDGNYWESNSMEAIAAGLGYGNKYTADEMGNRQAISCRKSEGHWRYVGSSEYSYCGIGTTWVDGDLYVCIMVGTINYG